MSFPKQAPCANPVYFRTYSRRTENGKETWQDTVERCVSGLTRVGHLEEDEAALIREQMSELKALPSGRWLWVGGTPWIEQQKNFSGAYNCTNTDLEDLEAFSLQMELLMMGSGTGAIIEPRTFEKLPVVRQNFTLDILEKIGEEENPVEHTIAAISKEEAIVTVGDSREGWCDAFLSLLNLACGPDKIEKVVIDLSHVRAPGSPIAGFGGVANPVKLAHFYRRAGEILSKAHGRKLTSVECCLLLDESSLAVVAGNVRRSAGMRQFHGDDEAAAVAKDNLWQQGEDGKWRIDPERDALRMANHTRVFHAKPTFDEVKASVTKQFYSGEGAIQYAPEAIARSSVDFLDTDDKKRQFLYLYEASPDLAAGYLEDLGADHIEHRMGRYGLNPCGEILGKDFHCNLAEIHLNQLDPNDWDAQHRAFKAGAIAAAALLHHEFKVPRYQFSREVDPIIGVSFTGLFDFFVKAFGAGWLDWWEKGRPNGPEGLGYRIVESNYLDFWRRTVEETVTEYCNRHGLRIPNRFTTVQPAGTKSLLTGAAPGWHPPKAARFIRRITFAKNDPVALACEAYGYKIIPSQSDRDETGALLDDPRDPRCTEWLVEIPVQTPWADLPGCDQYNINGFGINAQWDFYMQVQKYYTTHNTSATLEYREHEIEELSTLIHKAIQADEGYISAALLARFDANETFPRLPFEPIDRETYEQLERDVLERRITDDFALAMSVYGTAHEASGPAACDGDKCLFSEKKPQ
jgi:ribonucleotide reductase class II